MSINDYQEDYQYADHDGRTGWLDKVLCYKCGEKMSKKEATKSLNRLGVAIHKKCEENL